MRKIISIILTILTILSSITVFADIGNFVESGACGNETKWTFYETDDSGTLIISGNGKMYDYQPKEDYVSSYSSNKVSYRSNAPWTKFNSRVTNIIVEEGITYIGEYAFYNTQFITSVEGITEDEEKTYCTIPAGSLVSEVKKKDELENYRNGIPTTRECIFKDENGTEITVVLEKSNMEKCGWIDCYDKLHSEIE